MNEAIKLAIEKGGYRNDGINSAWILNGAKSWKFDIRVNGLNHQVFIKTKAVNQITNTFHNEQIGTKADLTSDPLFWQALGKALGWTNEAEEVGLRPDWLHFANEYFDLVLTGGDLDAFWKDLLNETPAPPQ